MKLLFGLGNPGTSYHGTRHNVGFWLLDQLAEQQHVQFRTKRKLQAELATLQLGGQPVLLAKPTTYYNAAGQAARALQAFYTIQPQDILVLHDDLALAFGIIRVRQGGSHAGNNGLRSLQQHIGSTFWHLRVGTHSPLRQRVGDTDFVLGKFSAAENHLLTDWARPTALALIDQFILGRLTATSHRHNPSDVV